MKLKYFLLILILMVGSLFAQSENTDSLDTLVLNDGFTYEGEYISMSADRIIFKQVGAYVGQGIDKAQVNLVKLADGTIIYPKEKKESNINFTSLGGVLIMMGGAFLFSNVGSSCHSCETFDDLKDFEDKLESKQKFGYGFIMLGGILVAIGGMDS